MDPSCDLEVMGPVSPDNVHETGVSPDGQFRSLIVAAEAEHVERTRRKTWSGPRSEVIVPCTPLTNAVGTFGGGTMLIAEFVILGALLGGVVGFGVGAALGPGPDRGAMYGLDQFVSGLGGGFLGLLIGATLGGIVGSVLKSRRQGHHPPDE
jgi:hypothetical protein